MQRLFDSEAPGGPATGRVVGVAVAANVWQTFDYLWPDALGEPQLGQRVRVPFGRGNRKVLAVVADTLRRSQRRDLKPVAELLDVESPFDECLWQLGQWISAYYLCPLGMTLAAMVPSAVGRHAAPIEEVVFLAAEPADWPSALGARQKRALDELFEARRQGVEGLPFQTLRKHSGGSRESVRRLAARGLVRLEARPVALPPLEEGSGGDPFELNEEQQAALAHLEGRLGGGFSVTLLYGVTGSGKTEIYVRAIRRVIEAGGQAILLVPEIALVTQTLTRLLARLPRVAVLHSGLTDAQRAFHYDQIRQGLASVVVGPRSAVFAPARKLGLIVVDEEHEPTYKQDTAPRYHGRDVAVKRAALAGVPVVLGSATPSLESLRNVQLGRYEMVRLPHRVRGLPMPRLQIVHLRREMQPGRIELIGRTLTLRIAAALDRDEQVILLMNRRGFASHVFCPSCGWTLGCESCTRSMVYHQATQLAMCHYCQHTVHLPERCPACKGKILLFGMGIQRIEGELARKFPQAKVARMDSDTMTSPLQFRRVFEDFSAGRLDILLGTQMVAKGLDFPRVSLVGVASADTALMIPDFRSSERTFQLIVQVAGRAGRGATAGEVVVQTLHEDEPAIRFAAGHDYDSFAAWEMPLREHAKLPPYWRLVRFLARHEDLDEAERGAQALGAGLRKLLPAGEVIFAGPQPAGVFRVRGQYRFQVLLYCRQAGLIQQMVFPRMEELQKQSVAEIVADADPVHLM